MVGVLLLFSACDFRSILAQPSGPPLHPSPRPPSTPAATGTRRYCQKDAVTGMNHGTGSTSNIPNKGAYSLFISRTVAGLNTPKKTHVL